MEAERDRLLKTGRIIIIIVGIISMLYSVVVATTPLLGEEAYVGTTYANLQVTNPSLARIIWHDTVGVGIITFFVSLTSVILGWKGLSRASSAAWYSLLVLWMGFVFALVLAHFPIGNTSFVHIGPGAILLSIDFLGIMLSARAVFKSQF